MITIGSLFSGIGGFELGLERAIPNSKTIWQVEINPYCRSVLKKHWPDAKMFEDVRSVGADNLDTVDILCCGFPCQNISNSGNKEGIHGEKSSLWFEARRIISELQPSIIVLENVSTIAVRGLSTVIGNLSELGYDSEWRIVSARETGAPHLRKRMFIVAYPSSTRGKIGISKKATRQKRDTEKFDNSHNRQPGGKGKSFWSTKPGIRKLVDGFSGRVDQLRALGNAIVPQCSELVGEYILHSGLIDDLS